MEIKKTISTALEENWVRKTYLFLIAATIYHVSVDAVSMIFGVLIFYAGMVYGYCRNKKVNDYGNL